MQVIDVDAKGEILGLKTTVNSMSVNCSFWMICSDASTGWNNFESSLLKSLESPMKSARKVSLVAKLMCQRSKAHGLF